MVYLKRPYHFKFCLSSANFTWSIIEYIVSNTGKQKAILKIIFLEKFLYKRVNTVKRSKRMFFLFFFFLKNRFYWVTFYNTFILIKMLFYFVYIYISWKAWEGKIQAYRKSAVSTNGSFTLIVSRPPSISLVTFARPSSICTSDAQVA